METSVAHQEGMTPPAAHMWLLAFVMAVLWAIITSMLWVLFALGFGQSRGNLRLISMLIVGAVVVAFLCAHAFRQGWKSGRSGPGRTA